MRDPLIAILQSRASWYHYGDIQAVTSAAVAGEIDELLPYALPGQESGVLDLAAVYAIADVLRYRRESHGDPLDLEEVDLLERACSRAADADKVALKVRLADACYMQFERARPLRSFPRTTQSRPQSWATWLSFAPCGTGSCGAPLTSSKPLSSIDVPRRFSRRAIRRRVVSEQARPMRNRSASQSSRDPRTSTMPSPSCGRPSCPHTIVATDGATARH